jgi:hypothetical protein
MKTTDYRAVLTDAFARLAEISDQRQALDIQSAKLQQFIAATINMLPDDESKEYTDALVKFTENIEARTRSLTEEIRKVLQGMNGELLTVTQVRDKLIASGFDFSAYTSNPLASVSTTLKRFKPDEVQCRVIGGVNFYRWKEVPKGMSSPPAYPG